MSTRREKRAKRLEAQRALMASVTDDAPDTLTGDDDAAADKPQSIADSMREAFGLSDADGNGDEGNGDE